MAHESPGLPNPFIIIRPSGMPYRDEITQYIQSCDFIIVERRRINDWRSVARKVYDEKFGSGIPGVLQDGAEAWLEGSELLFGKYAELLVLSPVNCGWNTDTAKSILSRIVELKRSYRQSKKRSKELLKIQFFRKGVWYDVFFDYIHCPDADPDKLKLEWNWFNPIEFTVL